MRKSYIILLVVGGIVLLQSFIPRLVTIADEPCLRNTGAPMPMGYNNMFSGSGECSWCHAADTIAHGTLPVMVDAQGNDVSPVFDWRATMMANSAKDPFWRAKVSHEVAVNPGLQVEIENTCTKCHAAQGHFYSKFLGQPTYSIADMVADPVALDGVSCTTCHGQRPDSLDIGFSGELHFQTNYTIYGPYTYPDTMTMINHINYTPRYSPHIIDAGLCSSCHTLITESVDLSGVPTGNSFVEQATYHEWLNSDYNESLDISCQKCHVPRIFEPIYLASEPDTLNSRIPFGKHFFVGGNSFMLSVLRDNIDTLGVTAGTMHFDTTIARTIRNLQYESLNLGIAEALRTPDTVFYDLTLENLAGHKFPSGYPSRRMFVTFVVLDDVGDTLFKSGVMNPDATLPDIDVPYEPHYNMINREDQVQVYEMIMTDISGNKTTVLERAYSSPKDNRLVPIGFSTSSVHYDTTKIMGGAATDPDFNYVGATEGSGTDVLHYHIPLAGYAGDLNVKASVYYQSVPPEFVQDMFALSTPEIDLFSSMYSAADPSPVLVKQVILGNLFAGLDDIARPTLMLFPNPSADGLVNISGVEAGIDELKVFNLSGDLVLHLFNVTNAQFILPETKGLYLVEVRAGDSRFVEQVIRR